MYWHGEKLSREQEKALRMLGEHPRPYVTDKEMMKMCDGQDRDVPSIILQKRV